MDRLLGQTHTIEEDVLPKRKIIVNIATSADGFIARPELAEAPKTAQHVSADGWQLVLSGLKTLLETGESMPLPQPAA